MVDDEEYYDHPQDIYISSRATNRAKLWFRALSRNREFVEDFKEKIQKGKPDEFHKLDEETKNFFLEKYGVQFLDSEYQPRTSKGGIYAGNVEGIDRYAVLLDPVEIELDGEMPEAHPEWPEKIHLVIDPRLPKKEVYKMVEYYWEYARSEMNPEYKKIDYDRFFIAIEMWDMHYREKKTYSEIADIYFPDLGDEWEEKEYDRLQKMNKDDEEIEKIIRKKNPYKETKIKKVQDMVKDAGILINGGFRDIK